MLAHGDDASEWRGPSLTQLAVDLAKAGVRSCEHALAGGNAGLSSCAADAEQLTAHCCVPMLKAPQSSLRNRFPGVPGDLGGPMWSSGQRPVSRLVWQPAEPQPVLSRNWASARYWSVVRNCMSHLATCLCTNRAPSPQALVTNQSSRYWRHFATLPRPSGLQASW